MCYSHSPQIVYYTTIWPLASISATVMRQGTDRLTLWAKLLNGVYMSPNEDILPNINAGGRMQTEFKGLLHHIHTWRTCCKSSIDVCAIHDQQSLPDL